MPEEKNYTIAAVDRALNVLEALAEQPDQGVTQLAKRLGMTKTIVFRLLSTLEARGFVMRDGDQPSFSLGYRISVLGDRAGQQNALLAAARPVLERLREDTAENINLVIREGNTSLALTTLAGRHAIRIYALSGRNGPLHAGGGSMLLLAWAPEDVQTAVMSSSLEQFTPKTITDPTALNVRLKQIRQDDYNIAIDDLDEGAFSIAAPIRNSMQDVIAAISVAGAIPRLNEERRQLYLELTRTAALEISEKLNVRRVN